MKKTVFLLAAIVVIAALSGCNKPTDKGSGAEQKKSAAPADINKELALKFLRGVQEGNKISLYEAANLTDEMVNESREKLIHSSRYKLTDDQRLELEHALRISGEIDFFIAKLKKMLPKSSSLQITQTTATNSVNSIASIIHKVKIVYLDKADAMHDKTGRPIKEMTVNLQQIERAVQGGRVLHEFSFNSADFEKMADRDFEVIAYWP